MFEHRGTSRSRSSHKPPPLTLWHYVPPLNHLALKPTVGRSGGAALSVLGSLSCPLLLHSCSHAPAPLPAPRAKGGTPRTPPPPNKIILLSVTVTGDPHPLPCVGLPHIHAAALLINPRAHSLPDAKATRWARFKSPANGTVGEYVFTPGQTFALYPQLRNAKTLVLDSRAVARIAGKFKPNAVTSARYQSELAFVKVCVGVLCVWGGGGRRGQASAEPAGR